MDTLDFTALTDDQLISLVRLAMVECGRRGAAVAVQAQGIYLDEAEKLRVAREAAEREAAKLRAAERERIAREAAEEVRRQAQAQTTATDQAKAEANRLKAAEEGRIAAEKMRLREEQERAWLRRAAVLVGRDPTQISLLYINTHYGWRVLINLGSDRYSRTHLVDWKVGDPKLSTSQALVTRKPDLMAFCAEFRAAHRGGPEVVLIGENYTFEEEPQPCQAS
jgi:hypothetical protein